jgi:hypothetical protein
VNDGLSPGGGRHHFFEAISFSIALSSIASANSRTSSFLTCRFTVVGVAPVWEKRGLPSVQAELRLKFAD